MMNFTLVLVLAVCGLASCHWSKCGPAFGKRPFDHNKFSGDWFVVGMAQSEEGVPMKCCKVHYTAAQHEKVTRTNLTIMMETKKGQVFHVGMMGQTYVPWMNSVTQSIVTSFKVDGGKEEKDEGSHEDNEAKESEEDSDQDKNDWSPVYDFAIIGTDYEQFAVIHSCANVYNEEKDEFLRDVHYHIWSRTPSLDATVITTLRTMALGFEHDIVKDMIIIDNSGC